jgi:hypothetical protein
MASERNRPESDTSEPPGEPKQQPAPSDDAALHTLFRALRIFLVPFVLSWAFAYVGSAGGAEWLYYAGLGGVTLSLVALMIWLIS